MKRIIGPGLLVLIIVMFAIIGVAALNGSNGGDAGTHWVRSINHSIRQGGGVNLQQLPPNTPVPGSPGPGIP